jgi:Ca2+-binding RTX toxin-like protein
METDDVLVESGVTIVSTENLTIRGVGSDHEVRIRGTVEANMNSAIFLGDNASADSNETVIIEPGGEVKTLAAIATIVFQATNSGVVNHGLIEAPNGFGIVFSGQDLNMITAIFNSGTIDVGVTAIFREFLSSDTLVLQNDGLISGGVAAYDQNGNQLGRDLITNTGQIIGNIFLRAGNDSYNGAQGRLTGLVFGEDGNDVITGGVDNDVFLGGAGNDILNGRTGTDTLRGGVGNDVITGGAGRDIMFGDAGSDDFDFNSVKDSVRGSKRDKINLFQRGQDDIDLRTIDAKTGVSGNNKFKWISRDDFSETKGELRYKDNGSTVIVQGDRNGDGKADFEIFVAVGSLAKGDFIL